MATQAFERLYRLTVDGTQAERQLKKLNETTSSIATGFARLRQAAVSTFGVFAAARGIQGLVNAADQLELLTGSFQALTGSADRAADMTERVFRTIEDTGSGLEDTASTFQRLTIGMNAFGASNEQIDAVANSFIKLGRISGTSMANTNAALVQFSQGLATGKLQGDELRSIMERLPLLTQLIADEWNTVHKNAQITRGDVKQMGREGKLTADILVNSLLRNFDKINDQFGKLVFTLDQELNVFKLRLTQAFASIAVGTGFGDAVKATVSAASEALGKLATGIESMSDDFSVLWLSIKTTVSGIEGMSSAILFALMPAIGALSVALQGLVMRNPILAFVSVATAALLILIARWDELKNLLLNEVPRWFYEMKGIFLSVMADMEVGFKQMWTGIQDFATSGVNGVIRQINRMTAAIAKLKPGGISVAIPELGFANAEEPISDFTALAETAFGKAAEFSLKFAQGLTNIADKAEASRKALELLAAQKITNEEAESAAKKRTQDLENLRDAVLNTLDPLRELKLAQEDLWQLASTGQISWSQFEEYNAIMDGSKKATEDAAEAVRRAKQDWVDYGISLKDSLDPMNSILRKMTEIDVAIEAGLLKKEVGESYKKMLLDIQDAADQSKDKIVSMLEQIKTAADGFVKDFTTTLVEGLAKGEFAFKQFAISILETMAKIVLNSIFLKFFEAILGTGVSAGSGATGGGFLRAGGDEGTGHTVGVLQSPTYGRGQGAGATPVKINVYNNAPVAVSTETSQNSDGSFNIELFIESRVNAAINNGGLDKSMKSSFGLSRRAF
jgi:tape measure domain-containing protein